jgi:Protein of unknown function (DUF3182)
VHPVAKAGLSGNLAAQSQFPFRMQDVQGHSEHASDTSLTPVGRPVSERVVTYRSRAAACTHERVTAAAVAKRLARLRHAEYAGDFAGEKSAAPHYFIPDDTLLSTTAADLGIFSSQELFGGVVPFSFVATKAITHPVPEECSEIPAGWSPAFGEKVRDIVLEGFTAFSTAAGHSAGMRLLSRGPVRIKPVDRRGGSGQRVVSRESELVSVLRMLGTSRIAECGVVLEENLDKVETYSVGFVDIGILEISYCGTQAITRNHKGALVYGGSRLFVVRGDSEQLLAQDLGADEQLAVAQAVRYEAAVRACFPGFFASRRNYDVLQGRDASRKWRSGVLEQSWRIGGASTAEIVALEAFAANPLLSSLRAVCVETYDSAVAAPKGASVFFAGVDQQVGPITKYALVQQ